MRFNQRLAVAFDLGAGSLAQAVERGSVTFDAHACFVQLADRRLCAAGFFAERCAQRSQRAFSFGRGFGEDVSERFDALRDVALKFVRGGFGIVRQALGHLPRCGVERRFHAFVNALVRGCHIGFEARAPTGFGFARGC